MQDDIVRLLTSMRNNPRYFCFFNSQTLSRYPVILISCFINKDNVHPPH